MKYLSAFLLLYVFTLPVKSQTKYERAINLVENAQLPQAVALFKEMIDSLYLGKHHKQFFEAQYYLAVSYLVLDRNPQAAEDSLRANLSKANELAGSESLEAAEMYFGLGWLHDNIRSENEAEAFYQQALEIQEKHLGSDHKKTVKTKTNYAQVLTALYKLGRGEKYLSELIKAYPMVYERDHPEHVRLYKLAYTFYSFTNQKEKALSYALAGVEMGEKNYGKNNPRMLSVYRDVSQAHYEMGLVETSIDYQNEELLLIERLIGNAPHARKAEVLNNLGRMYEELEQFEISLKFTKEALEMKKVLLGDQDPSSLSTALNLTSILTKTGNISQSNYHLEDILFSLEETEVDSFDINHQRALTGLVDNLWELGELDSVRNIVDKSFRFFRDKMSYQVLAGDKHFNLISMLEKLVVLSMNQSASNEDLFKISSKINWLDSLNSVALTQMNLRSDQLNFLNFYTAFNGIAIDHFYELYARTNDNKFLNEILIFSEKNKATILSPEYTIARLRDQINVPVEILEKERQLLSDLYSKSEEGSEVILKKKLSYDSLRDHLKNNYQDYYALRYAEESIDLSKIQSQLDENSIILSYVITENSGYLLNISNSQATVSSFTNDSLPTQSGDFREMIVQQTDIQGWAEKLFEKLMPISLSPKISLIISPYDYLSFLPFELLHNGNSYLGLSQPVSYTPSIEIWSKSREFTSSSNTKLLAMAPKFGQATSYVQEDVNRDFLVPLPGAEAELNSIGSSYDGEILKGEQATKSSFLKQVPHFGLVHLATHALVDNINPHLSRLYFSESVEDADPFLYNHELYGLKINADLVTLSACNTGIGEIQKGEGANSLARGFMYAGVPSTVVSLWPASDKSTPELMKHFYQNLSEGQPKDVALKNARNQYLETATGKAMHPFYWGGFVLIGDNKPIKDDGNLLVWLLSSTIIIVLILTIFRRKKRASN